MSHREGAVISTFIWIAIGVATWLVVAAIVGVLIGRMIRNRDRQVPTSATPEPGPRIPRPGTRAHPTGPPVRRASEVPPAPEVPPAS